MKNIIPINKPNIKIAWSKSVLMTALYPPKRRYINTTNPATITIVGYGILKSGEMILPIAMNWSESRPKKATKTISAAKILLLCPHFRPKYSDRLIKPYLSPSVLIFAADNPSTIKPIVSPAHNQNALKPIVYENAAWAISISPPKTAKIEAVVLKKPTLRLAIIKSDGVSFFPARQPMTRTARKYIPTSMKFKVIEYSKISKRRSPKVPPPPAVRRDTRDFFFSLLEKIGGAGRKNQNVKKKSLVRERSERGGTEIIRLLAQNGFALHSEYPTKRNFANFSEPTDWLPRGFAARQGRVPQGGTRQNPTARQTKRKSLFASKIIQI